MDEFPPNSQRAKGRPKGPAPEQPKADEGPKVQRVTQNEAIQRKRGIGSRFKQTFIEGNARMALNYMVGDVIIPTIQDAMIEALQGGIERVIKGDTQPRKSTAPSAYSTIPRTNYQSQFRSPNAAPPQQRSISPQSRSMHNFGEILLESRQEANDVIEMLYETLSRFGTVKVADLYTMTGIQSSHVDHQWGWDNLRGTKAVRQRNGRFLLDLPEPTALN